MLNDVCIAIKYTLEINTDGALYVYMYSMQIYLHLSHCYRQIHFMHNYLDFICIDEVKPSSLCFIHGVTVCLSVVAPPPPFIACDAQVSERGHLLCSLL